LDGSRRIAAGGNQLPEQETPGNWLRNTKPGFKQANSRKLPQVGSLGGGLPPTTDDGRQLNFEKGVM